jgi:hypothetical protein
VSITISSKIPRNDRMSALALILVDLAAKTHHDESSTDDMLLVAAQLTHVCARDWQDEALTRDADDPTRPFLLARAARLRMMTADIDHTRNEMSHARL